MEDKHAITVDIIKDIAKREFVESDATLEMVTTFINMQYNKHFTVATVQAWCISERWDEEKEKHKLKEKTLPQKLGMEAMRREADGVDYEKMTRLIEHTEEAIYSDDSHLKHLPSLVLLYKYRRDLRNSVVIGEDHNEVSKLLAKANRKKLELKRQEEAISVEVEEGAKDDISHK